MNNSSKAARESRITLMKARGHYRYDNMTAVEKVAYVAKYGQMPTPAQAHKEGYLKARRAWAAQVPGTVVATK